MSRLLLYLGLVIAVAAGAWWILAMDAARPETVLLHAQPSRPASDGLPQKLPAPEPAAIAPLTSEGSVVFTLQDGLGHSAWLPADVLELWRIDSHASSPAATAPTIADGELRVEHLDAGSYRATLEHRTLGHLDSGPFDVRGGETTWCRLPCEVADLDRRLAIRLRTESDRDFPTGGTFTTATASCEGGAPQGLQAVSDELLVLDDAEPRDHDVVVRWLNEPPITLHGVRPGREPCVVDLRGSATLTVVCRTADGRPVHWAALWVRFGLDPAGGGRVAGGTDARDRLTFSRLPACSVAVRARADGYAIADMVGIELVAGSTSTREITLVPAAQLAGRVEYAKGEPAVASVVALSKARPPEPPVPRSPWDAQLLLDTEQGGWFAWSVARTWDNGPLDVGRFQFKSLPEGTWRLVAGTEGGVRSEPISVSSTRTYTTPKEVVLRLPPARYLRGRLLVPAGGTMPRMHVGSGPGNWQDDAAVQPADVAPDGSFRLGPLTPGSHDIVLMTGEAPPFFAYWAARSVPGTIELGTIDMPADADLVRVLDIGDRVPGQLDVEVRIDGDVPDDVSVVAIDPDTPSSSLATANIEQRVSSRTGLQGVAHVAPIFARRVRLVVTTIGWADLQPEVWEVPSWGRADARVTVTLVSRSVRVQGADGRALSGSLEVARLGEQPWRNARSEVVDVNGLLHITAPAGTLTFSRRPSRLAQGAATLEWSAACPEVPEVTLGN